MFFSQFPSVAYDFNRTGTVQQMVNIFRNVRPETVSALNAVTLYKNYKIIDGMRPDVLSQKIYGTPDYYWTFFIINDFLHDGLQVWPMSQEVLRKYVEKNYSGKALCFKPEVVRDVDGIAQGTKNSVSGLLNLGELIYGSTSGAVGRLVRKDADLNEIILQDVAEGVPGIATLTGAIDETISGGGFRTGEFLSASQTSLESDSLDSQTLFSLQVNRVYDYSQAPAYYYSTTDSEKRPITNSDGIAQLDLYSELQWNKELQNQIPGFSLDNFGDDSTTNSINSNAVYTKPLVYTGGYNGLYTLGGDDQLNQDQIDADFGDVGYIDTSQFPISFQTNEQRLRDLNEERCYIKIIDPNYILDFIEEFEKVLNA